MATPAQARQDALHVCGSRKTGDLLLAKKGKCKKGWKKYSLVVVGASGAVGPQGPVGPVGPAGPQGPAGPAGQPLVVRDGNGTVIGPTVGGYNILVDGGIYEYRPDGRLASTDTVYFRDANCTGTAYVATVANAQWMVDELTARAGSQLRVVYRPNSPNGPARAWAYTSQTQFISSETLHYLNDDPSDGQCRARGSQSTGTLMALQSVTPPPDYSGPLIIG